MTRNSGTAAARPVLAVVAEPCSAPELKGAEQAEQGAELVPMSAAERAGTVARRAGNAVAELWLHPDRLIHSLWTGKHESMAEHFAYVKSRAWVPSELDGKKATAIAWAGFLYHALIGAPLLLFAKTLGGAAPRPLRLLALIVPFLILYFIVKGIL